MKIPRDISAPQLLKSLKNLGYGVSRQHGSHIRVTTCQNGEHHEVIPNHNPIKIGTLHSILKSVSAHHKMSVDGLLKLLEL